MRFIIMLSVILGLFSNTVIAEPRLALVIGNSDYLDFPLTNPVNDAVDMKEARVGWSEFLANSNHLSLVL